MVHRFWGRFGRIRRNAIYRRQVEQRFVYSEVVNVKEKFVMATWPERSKK